MKTRAVGLALCLVLLIVCSVTPVCAQRLPVYQIGIVKDGPMLRFPDAEGLFKKEIIRLSTGQFVTRFPEAKSLDGDWTVAGINKAIDRLMSDPGVDLIITMGQVSSNEVCKRRKLNKPVVASFIIDAQVQGLPLKSGKSGVKNLNYINRLKSVERDILVFRDVAPFNTLALLIDGYVLRAVPGLSSKARSFAEKNKIELTIVTVESSVEEALEKIPQSTEAVIVGPMFRLTPKKFNVLIAGLTERLLPSFSFWGRDEVELGILASMMPGATMQQIARGVAVNVQDILTGENAGSLKTAFSVGEQLSINMATARAIDVYPTLSILTEADLINEEHVAAGKVFTLESTVKEALTVNLDLAAADRDVAAGFQAVKEARSTLLPQLDIGLRGLVIDDDRARALAGSGTQPERSVTGSIAASQLIYSDKAWSNYSVQKHNHDSRTEERERVKLNIIADASIAYFNVLRTRTVKRIQKDNLKTTRANLERARVRQVAGIAGPEEVYRWESEIAISRQAVLEAESMTIDTVNELNRILHRPLQDSFNASEITLDDPRIIGKEKLYYNLVNNPKTLRLLRNFMVREGLEQSPEIRRYDARIEALERTLVSAKREFWVPDVSLQGNVSELLSESGEGQRDRTPVDIDDTDWSVGVVASLPLFKSGKNTAAMRKTREELAQLRIERSATADRIEQRILSAINKTRSSSPGIRLSREAAEAANKNFKLVTDSYSRGIKSIIDLVDAQNLALVSGRKAANAVYNFLVDVIGVQRAAGRFSMLLSLEERNARKQKMEMYFKEAGVDMGRL